MNEEAPGPPFLERLKPFGRVQGFLGQSIFPWPLIKWMWSRVIVMGKRETCHPLNGQILRFKCATRVLTLGYWDKSIQKQFPIIRIQKLWLLSKWSISTAQCHASCCESKHHGSCTRYRLQCQIGSFFVKGKEPWSLLETFNGFDLDCF